MRFFGFICKIDLLPISKEAILIISAGRNFFGGEARSTKGGLVMGVAAWGFPGAKPPGRRRSLQKFCKKNQWKIYNFLKDFQENFAIFSQIL